MWQVEVPSVRELDPTEMELIRGGDPVRAATLLLACFGAGFNFGYNTLGPLLFG
jgi:hypothetical protein